MLLICSERFQNCPLAHSCLRDSRSHDPPVSVHQKLPCCHTYYAQYHRHLRIHMPEFSCWNDPQHHETCAEPQTDIDTVHHIPPLIIQVKIYRHEHHPLCQHRKYGKDIFPSPDQPDQHKNSKNIKHRHFEKIRRIPLQKCRHSLSCQRTLLFQIHQFLHDICIKFLYVIEIPASIQFICIPADPEFFINFLIAIIIRKSIVQKPGTKLVELLVFFPLRTLVVWSIPSVHAKHTRQKDSKCQHTQTQSAKFPALIFPEIKQEEKSCSCHQTAACPELVLPVHISHNSEADTKDSLSPGPSLLLQHIKQ